MTDLTYPLLRPNQKNNKVVQIRMTNNYYEYLKFTAKKLNISMSEVIREALYLYLNSHY